MRLGIDIDGVVLDFVSAFCEICRRQGYRIRYEDIIRHDLGQVLGIGKRKLEPLILETLDSNLVKPYPGALDGLRTLRNAGHVVELITSRPESLKDRTVRVLTQHSVPHDKLLFAPHLGKIAQAEHLDVFVEDSLAEAVELADNGVAVLIYEHPWNAGSLNVEGQLRYVRDWSELVAVLQGLESEAVATGRGTTT